jgi:hypothetical protein
MSTWEKPDFEEIAMNAECSAYTMQDADETTVEGTSSDDSSM